MKLLATLAALFLLAMQSADDPSGDWKANLQLGPLTLRAALHLSETASSFDSPDQGAFGLPAQMTRDGRKVRVAIQQVGVFEGELSADGQTLAGTLMQGANPVPLTFTRGTFAKANRPQTPKPPFPYRSEEVAYDNPKTAGLSLAGTLTTPAGPGPFPAALLITGSGGQDRDETLFEHKPFLVLADALTRRGIAVLRVDDRGLGGSTRGPPGATTQDLATDVEAGVAWLRTRREIDPRRIGLIGHSEGGMIAPLVASRDPAVAFVVLWAGPGLRGDLVIVEQIRLANLAAGASAEGADRAAAMQRELVQAIVSAPDPASAEAAGVAVAQRLLGPSAGAGVKTMVEPWYLNFLKYDPGPSLRALKVPVLALLGEKDFQVGAAQNAPALRAALAGNPRAEVAVLPSLNHLFQTSKTGAVDEYPKIEETIAPIALTRMVDWVAAVTKP